VDPFLRSDQSEKISGYSRSTQSEQIPWLKRLDGMRRRKSAERSQDPAGFRTEPQPQQMEMMSFAMVIRLHLGSLYD